ncbi:MAG: GNAT family N-acetyltransferase [Armatimonadota bacterium]
MNPRKLVLNFGRQSVSLMRHSRLTVYSVEGDYDGDRLHVLIADDGSTLDYISNLIFPEGSVISKKRYISALKGPDLINSTADLVVVGANLLLKDKYIRNGFIIAPKWIQLFLPVDENPYTRLYNKGRQARKYFKWMIKKVESGGFHCEIVTDTEWLDEFYDKMYRPYALQRFGNFAVVHKYQKIKRSFQRGAGIIAKRNGVPVAGTIIYHAGDTMHIPHIGIVDGDLSIVREGAAFAMDYYAVRLAHLIGCKRVDFGHSRPFYSDGTLQYKLNWYMDVEEDDDGLSVFAIAVPGQKGPAMKFLENNKFFRIAPDGVITPNE